MLVNMKRWKGMGLAAPQVRVVDLENKEVEYKFQGLPARIVQHEIDHLNGVSIIDRGLS